MAPTAIPRSASTFSARLARVRRLPPSLLIGSVIVSVYFLVALTARFWAPYGEAQIGTGTPFAPMSLKHLMGTDQLGRDVFSRVVLGTDRELFIALTSTLIAMLIGGALGLFSGFVGGWLDELIARLIDLLISIPLLIFALLVITAAGPELSGSLGLLIAVVAIVYLPRIMRMARAVAVDLSTRDFIII